MRFEPLDELCYYCGSSGWQAIAYKSPLSENENIGVRPCACSVLPAEKRSLSPLREPEYRKRKDTDIWEKVGNQ